MVNFSIDRFYWPLSLSCLYQFNVSLQICTARSLTTHSRACVCLVSFTAEYSASVSLHFLASLCRFASTGHHRMPSFVMSSTRTQMTEILHIAYHRGQQCARTVYDNRSSTSGWKIRKLRRDACWSVLDVAGAARHPRTKSLIIRVTVELDDVVKWASVTFVKHTQLSTWAISTPLRWRTAVRLPSLIS